MIITFTFIALIIAIVIMIGLVVQNILISRKCNKYKQENEKLEEKIYDEIERLKDIKVEIQNTILEQAYEKGQIDALEKIRPEILKEMEKLKGNSGCNYFANLTIDNCIGKAAEILDKRIKENEQ